MSPQNKKKKDMKKYNTTEFETDSMSASQKSGAISLSHYVFSQRKDHTMFNSIDKRMGSKSKLNESKLSRTGSVL